MEARHKLISGPLLCLLLSTFPTSPCNAAGTSFTDILRGMAGGLALLGQSGNTTGFPYFGSGNPFYPMSPGPMWPNSGGFPAWGAPPWGGYSPYSPPYRQYPDRDSTGSRVLERLQGSWKTNKGGLLLIRRDMARLYISRDEYQDFYLRADDRYLWMWPIKSQASQRYEFHISSDRIVLRDEFGSSLTLLKYRPATSRP